MNRELLEKNIEKLQRQVDIETINRNHLLQKIEELKSEIKSINDYEEILSKVVVLFQKTSKHGRSQAKEQIEDIVTKCLQFIFETDIEFSIRLTERGEVPQAEFLVISNYDGYSVETKPEDSRGGGIVDIVSIALRLAFIQIHKPFIEGPILLDEPGKHVSSDYIFNLGEFLRQSSQMFRRQIIMVTHNNHLSQICDLSYNVDIKNGISIVEKKEELTI